MSLSAEKKRLDAALVTSLSDAIAQRAEREGRFVPAHVTRGVGHVPQSRPVPGIEEPTTRAADSLATTMRLVKAARFNAAERLERKQTFSLFTQSTVALYFVGLAMWQAVYLGEIDPETDRLVTLVQLVSSVFTLMLGLLEAMNDYKMKAHYLHNCALTVSELAQELKILRPVNPIVVQDFRERYNEALKACPVNHARIDFLFAKLDGTGDRWSWAGVYARYVADVYGLYVVFLTVPPLMWWWMR